MKRASSIQVWLIVLLCIGLLACQKNNEIKAATPGESGVKQSVDEVAASPSFGSDAISLYESWPKETELDNPEIPEATDLWISIIDAAKESIDFSEYYAISAPDSDLERVIEAIKRAGSRGVKIRFIVDKGMLRDDNAILPTQIAQWPNTELRIIDFSAITGGVQHAKYFIIDKKIAYFGSQNFDWRSLEHISELGALVQNPELVLPLQETFELDWALAGDRSAEYTKSEHTMPVRIVYKGEETQVTSALSPKDLLPDPALWDLPQILELIANAKKRIDIQLLNYTITNYDKSSFTEIDDALIAAAERGVKVRLMVSDWSKRKKYIADLQRLEPINNIESKMIVIPEASTGFIPFARTIHSKFMVVDEDAAWLGTSNWSGDYFYNSRNVGIVVKGRAFNKDLSHSFELYWDSAYAESTDPQKQYEERKRY
ncbi:MAG: phospholipase D-like domain-containing protein [Bradymonadales bacterium]|jgi:phosphatidylserine/phosphatidylglycerophosphate/cardiolipin synthase-like enzyme